LNLVRHLVEPEHVASAHHKNVLEENGMVGGMTPTLPLLPIPTHSLKKQVSWHEIGGSAEAAASEAAEERDGEYFVYSEDGAETHRPGAGH
jgi:hypothetical protein